mmetsp:Transcript_18809/g.55755  ORF Transcript_18809/g.55755 Transcript_18809/m.55755 type:complete len:233 (+) Transcript_18809:290-988(+)
MASRSTPSSASTSATTTPVRSLPWVQCTTTGNAVGSVSGSSAFLISLWHVVMKMRYMSRSPRYLKVFSAMATLKESPCILDAVAGSSVDGPVPQRILSAARAVMNLIVCSVAVAGPAGGCPAPRRSITVLICGRWNSSEARKIFSRLMRPGVTLDTSRTFTLMMVRLTAAWPALPSPHIGSCTAPSASAASSPTWAGERPSLGLASAIEPHRGPHPRSRLTGPPPPPPPQLL